MAHLKIRTGHQSTPTQDVQGAIQPQENLDNLQELKRVLKEMGQGKSPTSTIVDSTSPRYWIIRTAKERCDDEDLWSFKEEDQPSRDEYEIWLKRGGQAAGLRCRANYGSESSIDHVAIRLVDGASGNSCVGINFVAQHVDKKRNRRKNKDNDEEKGRGRCFMLVEDELSRNPEKLLMRLRMRKVAGSFGLPFCLERLKRLLREAPVLVVMPDVGIELVFWDQHALQHIAEEWVSTR